MNKNKKNKKNEEKKEGIYLQISTSARQSLASLMVIPLSKVTHTGSYSVVHIVAHSSVDTCAGHTAEKRKTFVLMLVVRVLYLH